jgi:hypothetical protein
MNFYRFFSGRLMTFDNIYENLMSARERQVILQRNYQMTQDPVQKANYLKELDGVTKNITTVEEALSKEGFSLPPPTQMFINMNPLTPLTGVPSAPASPPASAVGNPHSSPPRLSNKMETSLCFFFLS